MTRLWTQSDLHLQHYRGGIASWTPPALDEYDVAVVLGDVCNPMMSGLQFVADHYARDGKPCIYVPGNHCYYTGLKGSGEEGAYYEEQDERARAFCAQNGITLLNNDSVVIDGVRFLGATLWSDFSLLPPGWSRGDAMSQSQRGHTPDGGFFERAFHNDYREIRAGGSGSKHRLRPSQTLQWHRESMQFIKDTLAQPFEGSENVLLTHMGPASSVENRGMHSWLYGSADTESLIAGLADDPAGPQIQNWLHGHVHRSLDYQIGNGSTRVVCNPRGYPGENPDFDPELVIEVGPQLTPGMRI